MTFDGFSHHEYRDSPRRPLVLKYGETQRLDAKDLQNLHRLLSLLCSSHGHLHFICYNMYIYIYLSLSLSLPAILLPFALL